jgi:hypothetical protein
VHGAHAGRRQAQQIEEHLMRHTLLCATVAFVVASCARVQTEPATGTVDLDVENPAKQGEDWSGSLAGQGAGASITGTIRALALDGRTEVTVALNGASPNETHPWHVHEGACGSGGPIVGDASAYAPLQVGSAGSANGSANLALELNEAKDYYVNVHASASDLQTIIACGDLDD